MEAKEETEKTTETEATTGKEGASQPAEVEAAGGEVDDEDVEVYLPQRPRLHERRRRRRARATCCRQPRGPGGSSLCSL